MTEDKKPGGEGTKKSRKIPAKTAKKSDNEVVADEVKVEAQKISLVLALGMIIGSLVIGLGVGYAVAPKGTSIDYGATQQQDPGASAPALTPEQLEGNQLPPSHPEIPAPSQETTDSGSDSGAEDEPSTDEPSTEAGQ